MNLKHKKIISVFLFVTLQLIGLCGSAAVFGAVPATQTPGPRISATPSRMPTTVPSVTVSPAPGQWTLNIASFNRLAPADVLAEMYVFGGAGGFYGQCDPAPKPAQEPREIMDTLVLWVCWLDPDAKIGFRVLRPDGRLEVTSLRVVDGEVKALYQPYYDYPPGKYVMGLEGAKTSMAFQVIYLEPRKANLTEIHAAATPFWPALSPTGSRRRLLLDHFVPGEKVRLIAYKQTMPREPINMIGWQDLTMRSDGRLPVNIDLPGIQYEEKLYFAAFGERSGEVHMMEVSPVDHSRFDWAYNVDLSCPGAKAPRLHAWAFARVIFTLDLGPLVRAGPEVSSAALARLPSGGWLFVLGGPRCFDQTHYWEVDFYPMGAGGPATLRGWVAEADGYKYLLEPVQ